MSHGINMVPLINIVFLLLIFFMLSTTLVAPEKIPIKAPESKNSQEQKKHPVSLTITENGDIYYDGGKTSLSEIEKIFGEISQENEAVKVLIKADSNARTKLVVSILEVANSAGVGQVSLATQHPSAK